jgi:hypothetical protein
MYCKRLTAWLLIPMAILQSGSAALFCQQRVEQSPEVTASYETCAQFERILAEDLSFERAYEAAFARNIARRRAIAIADGEFGGLDFSRIADEPLLRAYKSRMQLFYLTLVLAGPSTDEEARLYFPAAIRKLMESKPPVDPTKFPSYAEELDRGATSFRAHIDELAARNADIAKRIREFKANLLSNKTTKIGRKIEPLRGTENGRVVKKDESYYEIGSYVLVQEDGEMKIVSVRFFTRLF